MKFAIAVLGSLFLQATLPGLLGSDAQGQDVPYVYAIGPDGLFTADLVRGTTTDAIPLLSTPRSPGTVAVSEDGAWAYVVTGGTISIVDLTAGLIVKALPVPEDCAPQRITLAPGGAFGYLSYGDWYDCLEIRVLDTVGNTVVGSFRLPNHSGSDDAGRSVAFAPDGGLAYITGPNGHVFIVDTKTQEVIDTIRFPHEAEQLAIGAGGERLYVGGNSYDVGKSLVSVLDTTTREWTDSVELEGYLRSLAAAPAGTVLYAAVDASTRWPSAKGIRVIDSSGLDVVRTILPGSSVDSLAVTTDGTKLLASVGDQVRFLATIDLATERLTHTHGISSSAFALGPATVRRPPPTARPWQSVDLAHSTRGCAYVWDWKDQKLRIADWRRDRVRQASVVGIAADEWVSDLAVSPDGRRAYLLLPKDIAVVDLATTEVVSRIRLNESYGHGDGRIYLSPDGTVAVAVPYELPRASVMDLINGSLVGDLHVSIDEKCGLWNGVVEDVAFSSDGRSIYVVGSCGDNWAGYEYYFLTVDAETGRVVDTIPQAFYRRRVVVRPDDRVAYLGSGDSIAVLDLDSRSVVAIIPTPSGHGALAVSVDGSLLLAAMGPQRENAGSLSFIDTATNRRVGEVPIVQSELGDQGLIAIDPAGDGASFVDLLPTRPSGGSARRQPIMWSDRRPRNVAISESPCAVPIDSEPIRIPTRTPTATPVPAVQIEVISSPSGVAGEALTVEVVLRWSEGNVAGIQVDLPTDGALQIRARTDGKPDCAANHAIGKNGTAFSFTWDRAPSYGYGRRARAFVLALDNVDPIANGSVLLSCQVAIGADAAPGRHELPCTNAGASDGMGRALPAECHAGEIVVLPRERESAVVEVRPPQPGGGSGCEVGARSEPAKQWLIGLVLILLSYTRRRRRDLRSGSRLPASTSTSPGR